MALRRQFLEQLFKQLEAEAIPYCVSRNYSAVYENSLSDIDLLVEPRNLPAMEKALYETMRRVGAALFRKTDFICRSYLFFAAGEFLHIDVEYGKRWRFFHIMAAADMLEGRQAHGAFHIPSPEVESMALWTQALWAGKLTQRYRGRLAELFAECTEGNLRRVYGKAFGPFADRLLNTHAHVLDEPCPPAFFAELRRGLVRRTLLNPPRWWMAARYLACDFARLGSRLACLPGLRCEVVSRPGALDCTDILKSLEIAYPLAKCEIRETGRAGEPPSFNERVRTWAGDFARLFRGGIVLEHHTAEPEAALPALLDELRRKRKWLNYGRTFVLCRQEKPNFVIYDGDGVVAATADGPGQVFLGIAGAMAKRAQTPPVD